MTQNEIETILTRQREYYAAGHTLSYAARRGALRKLQDALRRHEADLSEAIVAAVGALVAWCAVAVSAVACVVVCAVA